MPSLKDLNKELLQKWNENTTVLLFVIKNDTSIIEFSENFPLGKNSFKYMYDFLTYTHKSSFKSNLEKCIKEKSIATFRTNFSYDSSDVEDIPHSYNIVMQYTQDDKILIVAEPIAALSHDNAKAYFSMVNDSSYLSRKILKTDYHLNKKNEELKYYANYDVLTKVYNRRKIFKILNKELSKFQRLGTYFSIVMIDIDDFKNVNDKYGHQSGDIVLCEISNLLKEMCREYDSVGRIGGEEFLIVLPSSDLKSSILFANRMLNKLRENTIRLKNGEEMKTTFSAGVVQIEKDVSADDLIGKADTLLYEAKKSGKNQVK